MLFFSLSVMFFVYLAIRTHSLSLKFNIIKLCPPGDWCLLFSQDIAAFPAYPLRSLFHGTFLLSYQSQLSVPFVRLCTEGYRSSLHWIVFVYPPCLLLYICLTILFFLPFLPFPLLFSFLYLQSGDAKDKSTQLSFPIFRDSRYNCQKVIICS